MDALKFTFSFFVMVVTLGDTADGSSTNYEISSLVVEKSPATNSMYYFCNCSMHHFFFKYRIFAIITLLCKTRICMYIYMINKHK